ncbi:MAG: hypothetical protein F6J93_26400 [Oscillatoria sp. SIO1A7]|nr:hypothetical protein [Oscillatoria sp. SIO1A7]
MTKTPPPPNRPDRFELSVRFVCGAILGIVIAISAGLLWEAQSLAGVLIGGLIFALIFGFLTARYGDKFWKFLADLFHSGWW